MQAVEASLKRLRTDYIDLYWVHIWDRSAKIEEVMRGLDLNSRQMLQASLMRQRWIAQANTHPAAWWSPFVGLQIEYSLIERTIGAG